MAPGHLLTPTRIARSHPPSIPRELFVAHGTFGDAIRYRAEGELSARGPYTARVTGTAVSERRPDPGRQLSRLGFTTISAIAAFSYLVMIGGTDFGEVLPHLQVLNGIIAGALILAFIWELQAADRFDRLVLLAVLFFAAAGLLSSFPRQSMDATLAALTYAAALFVARGLLTRDHVRDVFARVLQLLSLVVTVVIGVSWFGIVIEWMSVVGVSSPPLGFELPAGVWAHRHDVALLVVLLYPSWWLGRPSVARRVTAVAIGLVVTFIVVFDGSRILWLALGVATVVVAGPIVIHRWPRRKRTNWLILGAGLTAAAVMLVVGAAAPIVERALSLASLEYRTAMWGPLTGAWLEHPIGGLGPGSFPWALQTTGYFDANAWAPRHPDSIVFQLLPEAGLLGMLAVACVAMAIVPAVWRGRSTAAQWALLAFAAAGIGANPTDFAFLVVVSIGWAAYAAPRDPRASQTDRPPPTWAQYAGLLMLAVIGLAFASTMVASFAYASAASSVRNDELRSAEAALNTAVAFDPGMALYARQRGANRLLLGDLAAATEDLERAVQLNPSDDLAWRTLALAHAEAGNADAAIAAAAQAVTTQRSDPSNLLLASHLALETGRYRDALDLLSQLVQAWPEIAAAPGWEEFVTGGSLEPTDVVRAAAERQQTGGTSPRMDALLLAVVAGAPVDGEISELSRARRASLECNPAAADMLSSASEAERRGAGYWEVEIRSSGIHGTPDDSAIDIYELLTGKSVDPDAIEGKLNPLHQSDYPVRFGIDLWGYRRVPIAWPVSELQLPDPTAGATRWLLDPISAGRAAGVAACR